MSESIWGVLEVTIPIVCLLWTTYVQLKVASKTERVERLENTNEQLLLEKERWQNMFDWAKTQAIDAYSVIEGHHFLETHLAKRAGKDTANYRKEVRQEAGVKNRGFYFYSYSQLNEKKRELSELSAHSSQFNKKITSNNSSS